MKSIKHFVSIILAIFATNVCEAQSTDPIESALEVYQQYINGTQKEKEHLDSLLLPFQENLKNQQVISICGIPFGASRENSSSLLKKKYGNPSRSSFENAIVYNRLRYGGIDFDSAIFGFQSDGNRTYFNYCVLVQEAKNKEEAEQIIQFFYSKLSKKYDLTSITDENGFLCYAGGISPIWDGNWLSIAQNIREAEYLGAVHIEVIDYKGLSEFSGIQYGVRIKYGPYEYVNEDF